MRVEENDRDDVARLGIVVDTSAVEAATKAFNELTEAVERARVAIAAIAGAKVEVGVEQPKSSKWMG